MIKKQYTFLENHGQEYSNAFGEEPELKLRRQGGVTLTTLQDGQ